MRYRIVQEKSWYFVERLQSVGWVYQSGRLAWTYWGARWQLYKAIRSVTPSPRRIVYERVVDAL